MAAAAGARGGWYADRGFTKSYKVGPDDHPAGSLSSETNCNATGVFLLRRDCARHGMFASPLVSTCSCSQLLVSLIAVTATAWAFTLYQPFAMSASMGSAMGEMEGMAMEDMAMDSMAAGWSFAGLLIFVTLWTIMMVAMMLPAAAPMILIFAAAQARRDRHVAVPTWIFVAGYILVWAAAGLGAYVLDQAFTELLRSHASIDPGTWAPLALGTPGVPEF